MFVFFFLGSIDVNSNLINLQSVQTKSFPCAFTAQLFIDFVTEFVFEQRVYGIRHTLEHIDCWAIIKVCMHNIQFVIGYLKTHESTAVTDKSRHDIILSHDTSQQLSRGCWCKTSLEEKGEFYRTPRGEYVVFQKVSR